MLDTPHSSDAPNVLERAIEHPESTQQSSTLPMVASHQRVTMSAVQKLVKKYGADWYFMHGQGD